MSADAVVEEVCSFCKRPKSAVTNLIRGSGNKEGRAVFICNLCVKLVQGPHAWVAACALCFPENGKHARGCPESKRSA